ncbi:MAG: hypothetical protein WAW92_02140 [Minisyncoccia bacterium]
MKNSSNEKNILEVIRTFYTAEVLLKKEHVPEKADQKTLEDHLAKIKTKSDKMSKRQLLKFFFDNWTQRYDNYMNSEWELREINLADCGVWPKMGNLPEKFTQGNLLDTAISVDELLVDRNKITYKTSRVLYIEELVDTTTTVLSYIPPIVIEGGVIRNNKLKDKMVYKRCKYDIDDGNHRMVALALLGETKVLAWVGKRIYKNKLLY